jgi:hypothetical protein
LLLGLPCWGFGYSQQAVCVCVCVCVCPQVSDLGLAVKAPRVSSQGALMDCSAQARSAGSSTTPSVLSGSGSTRNSRSGTSSIDLGASTWVDVPGAGAVSFGPDRVRRSGGAGGSSGPHPSSNPLGGAVAGAGCGVVGGAGGSSGPHPASNPLGGAVAGPGCGVVGGGSSSGAGVGPCPVDPAGGALGFSVSSSEERWSSSSGRGGPGGDSSGSSSSGDGDSTQWGHVLCRGRGTPGYMAPEQYAG